ncbi:MAG: hypothetical protein O7B81_00385 [Gammaproteobacteria bacterium]|nr:hypothetical protein [Gammaproteobacteria bacterium]
MATFDVWLPLRSRHRRTEFPTLSLDGPLSARKRTPSAWGADVCKSPYQRWKGRTAVDD